MADVCPRCDPVKVRNRLASSRLQLADAVEMLGRGNVDEARALVGRAAATLSADAATGRRDHLVMAGWAQRVSGAPLTPEALTQLRGEMFERPLEPAFRP